MIKKLSKKQMIYHLSTILKNRGIDKDLIDLEALVDENLTYEENKQIVLEHLKHSLEKDEKELKNYEGKNVEKSIKTDKRKKAKKRLKPTIGNIIKWMINPAECDLIIIDK